MRRMSAAVFVAALTLSIMGGCGEAPRKLKAPKAFDATIVLGFSQVGAESGWRIANTKSIRNAAGKNNIDLIFEYADGQQSKQISAIRSFIARKVDVIAFSPVVETGWDQVLTEARQAHIPVIVTDRNIATADPTLYTGALGSDFLLEGSQAALLLTQKYRNSPGPVRVVEIEGGKGSGPAVQRKSGFDAYLAHEPKFTIIDSVAGDWTRARGRQLMKNLLKKHKDIDAVFAHNDDMGLGATAAIRDADKKPGNDIKIVTVDATREAMEALAKGDLNVVVECNPLIGPQLMNMVVTLYLGGSIPKQTWTDESVFDQNNVRDALADRSY